MKIRASQADHEAYLRMLPYKGRRRRPAVYCMVGVQDLGGRCLELVEVAVLQDLHLVAPCPKSGTPALNRDRIAPGR